MTDDELVAHARAGDAEARRTLVERTSLRTARAILGDKAQDRFDALRELASGDGPAPAVGPLLASIAATPAAAPATAAPGELRRAAELVYRARSDRWGPPERAAIGRFAARHGAHLGHEHALELLEWAARYPGDVTDFVRGAAAGLADVPADAWPQLAWRTGLEEFVMRDRELVVRLAADPASARAVARALLSGHARARGSCVPALEAIWDRVARRDVWAAALAEATGQNRGMSGRDELAAWAWRRFCAREDERRELYTAFEAWRDDWIELRNAMPADRRPGGASALAHLRLWAGLDVERLSATVDEAVRLARDADWPGLVDAAFDLAEAAPHARRLHALAGACRMAYEVTNRTRDDDTRDDDTRGALPAGLAAAADRLAARASALAARLRDSGAVIDPIVANRAEDLETCVRLMAEAHERRAAAAAYEAERAQRAHRAAEAEQARRAAEAELRRHTTPTASATSTTTSSSAAAAAAASLMPAIDPDPIDAEIFFPSLPAPSLLAYARLFKRLTSGDPDAVQSLAADGVPLEMIAVINQTWSALFASRTDLAIRFSRLISATWA